MNHKRFLFLRRDLGLQLLAAYLLFVGLVALAAYTFQRIGSERQEADVRAADLALARAIGQETSSAMGNALQAVSQLATYPEVIQTNSGGMADIFRTLMSVRSDVNLAYRLDADGIMAYHYPEGPESTVGDDFSFRDYFQYALTTHEPFASRGRISPTTNQPVATAVMPLWDGNGQFLGVVATNITLESLSHALTAIVGEYQPEERLQITIVDASGQIVAHPDATPLLQDSHDLMPSITPVVLKGDSGSQIIADANGEETLYSYVPIESVGWGVVVSRPTAVAFASVHAFQRGASIAIAIFLVGGLIFWLSLTRVVIVPMARLASYSQSIGQDDLSTEQQADVDALARRPDQLGHLTRSLQRMQKAIQARLNELATLLQTSGAVVSTLDSQTVLNRILEQVERLMDIQMCAIFALDQEKGIFRIYASRGLSDWYIQHATVNPDEPGSVTMRAIHSGEPIQVSDTETNPSFVLHRGRARMAGYRSILAVPLNAQYTPPAALLVFRPEPYEFTQREINLLSSFANHAAMAIENAALYARSDTRLQEQTRRLEALIQSMQDGLILEDLQGQVLYINRRIAEWADITAEDASKEKVETLMAQILTKAKDAVAATQAISTALNGANNRRADFTLLTAERPRHIRLKVFDVTDSAGMRIGRGRILQDITQRYELDRMKSSLISTVSHELRTPLAAIKGYTSTLLADDVEWDLQSQREFLDIISVETDHLSELVNDLLDMSRIEAGNLKVSRTTCELSDLIYRAAKRSHLQPEERLDLILPSDLPSLYVDAQRIEAVLRNLIENAAKYGGKDTPIHISAERQNGHLIVWVEDEGPGIAAEHRGRIFDSFYRVEDGLTRSTAGAGLGLAISQGFVRAHGGDIWLEQRDIGTCVAFSLPLVAAEAT